MEFKEEEQNLIDALKTETNVEQRNGLIDIVIEVNEDKIKDIEEEMAEVDNMTNSDVVRRAAKIMFKNEIEHYKNLNDVLRSLKLPMTNSTGGRITRRKKSVRKTRRKNNAIKRRGRKTK